MAPCNTWQRSTLVVQLHVGRYTRICRQLAGRPAACAGQHNAWYRSSREQVVAKSDAARASGQGGSCERAIMLAW